ncbi:hypothetical protein [Klebsiella pneumoniae]|uniref:hypothetical protein n=1 Tax=Klebsiella pneumoniae TaxID=573 RepID=UPI001D0DE92B|nr:hypothetical protein [Klebsiella pneumoniae]
MTSKFNIDNRELLQRISCGEAVAGIDSGNLIVRELAAFRLAAMDSEPVAWLRNPDQGFHLPMLRLGSKDPNPNFVNEEFYPVYAAPQPEPVVPDENTLRIQGIEALEEFLTETTPEPEMVGGIKLTLTCCRVLKAIIKNNGWADFNGGKPEKVKAETIITALREPHPDACRAAMLQASPVCTCPSGNGSLRWPFPVHPGGSQENPDCWCRTCRPVVLNDMRFVVCPDCGNKRCPRANDHRNACTGSNEPGQQGSAYPSAPQEVKP